MLRQEYKIVFSVGNHSFDLRFSPFFKINLFDKILLKNYVLKTHELICNNSKLRYVLFLHTCF